MLTYRIADVNIFSGSIKGVISLVSKLLQQKKQTYICVSGAHGVVEVNRDRRVLEAHQNAGLVVPDGMPLVWIGRAMGYSKTERIYGPDLFLALCRRAQEEKWRVFFYGCTTQVLGALSGRLHERFPKLIIAGSYAPPFRALTEKESKKIIQTINASRAHIVFVGLSTPKQELWMQEYSKKLRASVLVGVGAAFDFVAGTKKQAPRWMQRYGLEWLFRLSHEPMRLWRRYTVGNAIFLYVFFRHLVTRTFSKKQ